MWNTAGGERLDQYEAEDDAHHPIGTCNVGVLSGSSDSIGPTALQYIWLGYSPDKFLCLLI